MQSPLIHVCEPHHFIIINPNSLDNKGSCWILKDFYCSVTMLRGLGLRLTLLLLVPFSYKLMHHLKPFTIVVLNGEITVYSVDFPKWFWMVGQLIQNLVWIFPNGSTSNTKPCLDTSKWWINVLYMYPLKRFELIWMVVQLATNTVQMVSPCVYKTNGHFESGHFEWFQMVYQ